MNFYDRHPISEQQVLAAVARRRGGDLARLTPDDLFEFDQDHYGGLKAVDDVARRAGITAAGGVLGVCAGLAGPARFLASRRGCRVLALELHAGRAAGAARLNRLVGLDGLVSVVRGDATTLPFRDGSFDACVSQEALLHVDDKLAVLAGCRRILVPGGRFVFTDWIARATLGARDRARFAVTSPRPWLTTMSRFMRPLASRYSPATATLMTRLAYKRSRVFTTPFAIW